jgi:hypothetical protein
MDNLPFTPCADLATELGIELPEDVDEGPALDGLAGMDNVLGEPLAANEAQPPLVEAAPVEAAVQAQYVAPQAVQPAAHADLFWDDLGAAGLPAAHDPGDANLFLYDFPVYLEVDEAEIFNQDLPIDLEMDDADLFDFDMEADDVEMVLNEAGPVNELEFQQHQGPPEGFGPIQPLLNNLPNPMMFEPGKWEICEENLEGLSYEQHVAVSGAGDPEHMFNMILDEWGLRYRQGLPAFDGAPLEWMVRSEAPGMTPDFLAAEFQNRVGLSNQFMQTANGNVNGGHKARSAHWTGITKERT